jgi:hypothetical protein
MDDSIERSSKISRANDIVSSRSIDELADLDQNGTVNILDVTMVAKDFGKTV